MGLSEVRLVIHCLKKLPTFDLLQFEIHVSITIIFGTDVAEKVGNQNITLFSGLT